MEKITLSYIALALKKQYVPGKVILKWIRDYRIKLIKSKYYKCQHVLILQDLETQALRLMEEQDVDKRVKMIRRAWEGK
ncbi:hypothetical protein ACNO7L_05470 [Bisgaard Taxon 45]